MTPGAICNGVKAGVIWQDDRIVLTFFAMNVLLSPIVSEFETEEQESSHNLWFRDKVEEALHSKEPRLPHDAAMAKVQTMLEERRKARANNLVV